MQTGSNTTVWREHGGVVTGFLSHPLKLHFNWRISTKKQIKTREIYIEGCPENNLRARVKCVVGKLLTQFNTKSLRSSGGRRPYLWHEILSSNPGSWSFSHVFSLFFSANFLHKKNTGYRDSDYRHSCKSTSREKPRIYKCSTGQRLCHKFRNSYQIWKN